MKEADESATITLTLNVEDNRLCVKVNSTLNDLHDSYNTNIHQVCFVTL